MKQPPDDLARKVIAAAEQFSGTGFDVSMDDVATAADVPRATLYYYFSGRDDLVSFFLAHKLNTVSDAIAKAAAGEGSVVDRLRNMTYEVLYAMQEAPVLCTELPGALRNAGTSFSEVAMKADQVMAAPVRELLIEGRATGELMCGDIETTASAMHGMIGQAALTQLSRTGAIDARAMADELNALMFEGLIPR